LPKRRVEMDWHSEFDFEFLSRISDFRGGFISREWGRGTIFVSLPLGTVRSLEELMVKIDSQYDPKV